MKKQIKRFWGVGLILIILASLVLNVAPVYGAEPLRWESKTGGPSATFSAIASGKTIADYAIAADAKTMYAACGANFYQSTNGGSTWTDIYSRLPATAGNTTFVALAPDDPSVVVVVTNNTSIANQVAISVNGGTTFTDMVMTTSTTQTIKGVAVSPMVTGGFRYIAVYGQASTTVGNSILYYYNYGSGVGSWVNAVSGFSTPLATRTVVDNIVALTFSPNFASDYMAVGLTEQKVAGGDSLSGNLSLHALSFNSLGWDTVVSTGYPVTVTYATAGAIAVNSASVALGPDYMGGDETLRIAFVGADITGTGVTPGGIWRCNDVAASRNLYNTAGVNSVAYDGTSLAAGAYASNNVYHCADPLASSPTVLGARSYKRIGVDATTNDMVKVMFVGETLFGSKQGTGGAMSKSLDAGTTWNDFTLINMSLTNLDDILVSPDGATWYLAVHDANLSAVFRMSPMQRVLCVAGDGTDPDFMLRGLDSDPDVVYAVDKGGTTLYYSADGGVSRWQQRLNVPAAITDLAVESAGVIYFGSGVNIYKSINSGFTWNTPVNTTATGNIVNLLSLGENNLLISTAAFTSNILYSTDGAATWTRLLGIIGGPSAKIAATGLASGDYIFAAPAGNNDVWRFKVGTPGPGAFEDMNTTAATGQYNTGLVYTSGVLYAISTNVTSGGSTYLNSSLYGTMSGVHTEEAWRTPYNSGAYSGNLTFAQTPSALKASTSTGKVTLLAIDVSGSNSVKYYNDTLALSGPAITGPADEALIQANSVTGYPMAINLMWSRISLATGYEVLLALDSNFESQLNLDGIVTTADSDVAAEVAGSYTAMSLIIPAPADYGLNPGTTFYWKVRADTPISSAWSETRSITIQPVAAAVPALASPVNGSTIKNQSPAFSWSPVTGCTQYEFQLSTTPTFGTQVLTDTPASAGTLVPVTIKLEKGKQYFWRVRAFEPIQGDWSTAGNFLVAVDEPEPTTAPPPVTVTNAPPVTITIPPASPAPTYTLAPPAQEEIAPTYIWAIIIIGAILVIAVIVLIVRTRRSV